LCSKKVKMLQTFYKYQGAGNDFVLIDNRLQVFPKNNTKLISHLCDRRFGVGADGLILLENSEKTDFKMIYFNSDGNESTMCGNGGRCIVAFAKFLNIISSKTIFTAIDGLHKASINEKTVSLQMIDVNQIRQHKDYLFLDTGSPHHVIFVDDVAKIDVKKEGSAIRYSGLYVSQGGSNINFVTQKSSDTFDVRTYERGVEDETLACGTGVTAVAIAAHKNSLTTAQNINLTVLGGSLSVSFDVKDNLYTNVFLNGPAEQVFKGEIEC
jgi:diaminopimelate epimerase